MSAPKVLLLEDNPGLRQTLAKLLAKRGYQVRVVASGEEAVQAAAGETFDLFVTDIKMQGMGGLDALEAIKRGQPGIASLLITGYHNPENRARAEALGAGDTLTKPLKPAALIEAVSAVLAKGPALLKAEAPSGSAPQPRRKSAKSKAKGKAERAPAAAESGATPEAEVAPEPEARSEPEKHSAFGAKAATLPDAANNALFGTLFGLLEALLERTGASGAGLAAQQAALRLGHTLGEARWIRVAVLAKVALDAGRLSPGAVELPAEMRGLLESLDRSPGELSPEARLVSATLELCPDPSQYDPRVLIALAAERQDGRPCMRRLNGLLALAATLREEGHLEGSREALEAVAEYGQGNRPAIEAELTMSVLDNGQKEDNARALEALASAARLGPRSEGQAYLRAGVLWSPLNPERGRAWLERSAELGVKANDPLLAATAQLALVRFSLAEGGYWPYLKPLAHPQGAPERAEAVPWLLPGLLSSDEPEVGKVLELWAVDYPELFDRLIASGSLDETLRRRAVEIVAARGQRPPTLRVLSFGDFQVYRGTELSQGWKTQKVRYLLAFLVGCGSARVADETLIDKLWPELEPVAGRESLSQALSLLQAHLREDFGLPNLISRDDSGIAINPDVPIWHDVEELSKLAKRAAEMAKKGQPEMEAVLRRMLDLYRGPYLDGCYMGWALERRQQMERYARESASRLLELTARRGQLEQVVEVGLRALELAPGQEAVAVRVLRAYEKMGREGEARTFYSQFRQTLGHEPSAELAEVGASFLQGD